LSFLTNDEIQKPCAAISRATKGMPDKSLNDLIKSTMKWPTVSSTRRQ
jgi:hypothetical protein